MVKLSAKSALAEAFRYTIKRREALTRFVTDGRLEVDNNIAENAMRGIALGRRTISSPVPIAAASGQRPSTPSWRRRSSTASNPEAYLKDMLTKIADGHPINRIDELMPWRMTSTTAPQPP